MHHPFKNLLTWSSIITSCVTLALTTVSTPARADDVDTQQWTIFIAQKDLSERWRAYFEIQPRFGNDISTSQQLLIRPAVSYQLTPKLSVWGGYAWTPVFEPDFRDEHRLWQQLLFEDKLGETGIALRGRLEERFIEGAGDTAFRLRNMIRLSHPISADKKWAVVGYDEVWWNLNTTSGGPVSGFDQNWAFAGVSCQVNPKLRVETGYQLVHQNVPHTSENRRLNVWVVQFNMKI